MHNHTHLINFFVGFASIFILTAQFGTVIVQSFVGAHGMMVKVRFNICEQVISS